MGKIWSSNATPLAAEATPEITPEITPGLLVPLEEEESSSPEFFIQHLQKAVDESTFRGGNFASSAVVNARARITSDLTFQKVASHFRAKGYVVDSPVPLTRWLQALQEADRNGLTAMRGIYTHITLGNVILVQIPYRSP